MRRENEILSAIANLTAHIDAQFGRIDSRLDAMAGRLDRIIDDIAGMKIDHAIHRHDDDV